jgi:hypothetical protein
MNIEKTLITAPIAAAGHLNWFGGLVRNSPRFSTALQVVWQMLLPIAAMFLASRAVLLLIATLTATHFAAAGTLGDASWISYLCRFDCNWYLSIATGGYSSVESTNQPGATNFGFFPLFPLLTRFFAPLFGGDFLAAATAVTNICFYAALVYIYRYALLLHLDRRVALLTVGLLCVMPQSIAFSAAYAESPFLLLLAAAMFYLRREQYLAAGIAAALLSATRANGVLFIVFAIAWVVRSDGFRALLTPWRTPEKYVPILFAPLGLFLYWGYCFIMTGDAFAHPSTEFHGWGWRFSAPWKGLRAMFRDDGVVRIAVLYSLGVFACAWLLIRQRLYEEFLLCGAFILLMWSGQMTGSIFRYWLVLFPLWIALARILAVRPATSAMTFSILGLLNGIMMSAWTLQNIIAI